MAATFHVYVDGAVDASPDGLRALATTMSARYGLPAADLVARLGKGRFRVKANVDQQTASTYQRDLAAIGARCTLEPADAAAPASRTTMPPATAPRATAPTAPRTTAPPATAPRTTTPPATSALPQRTAFGEGIPRPSTPPPVGGYQSGLAAAFSNETPSASLGALAGDLSSFSLGSVDGAADKEEPPAAAFVPPPGPVAVPVKAAAKASAKVAKPKDEPLDLFAPPDAQAEANFTVDLAPEEEARAARKRMSTPPPSVKAAAPVAAPARRGGNSLGPPEPTPAPPREWNDRSAAKTDGLPREHHGRAAPASDGQPRGRFAAGVVLAIVLGFVPAHCIAAAREHSAFSTIDQKIDAAQRDAVTPDAYAALDRLRDEQVARKATEQRSIMLMALAIWAVVGGGIAYVWFRRIPWAS